MTTHTDTRPGSTKMQTTAERLAITQASIDQSVKPGPAINAPVSTLEQTVIKLRAQRDELLEALEQLEGMIEANDEHDALLQVCRAAIQQTQQS